jgi:hypothetical protein
MITGAADAETTAVATDVHPPNDDVNEYVIEPDPEGVTDTVSVKAFHVPVIGVEIPLPTVPFNE